MSISRALSFAADPSQPKAVREYFAAEAKRMLDQAAPEPVPGCPGAGAKLLGQANLKSAKK